MMKRLITTYISCKTPPAPHFPLLILCRYVSKFSCLALPVHALYISPALLPLFCAFCTSTPSQRSARLAPVSTDTRRHPIASITTLVEKIPSHRAALLEETKREPYFRPAPFASSLLLFHSTFLLLMSVRAEARITAQKSLSILVRKEVYVC